MITFTASNFCICSSRRLLTNFISRIKSARRTEDPLIADSNADAGILHLQDKEGGGGGGGGGFLGAATAAGESSQPAQQNQLQRLNQLTLASELAVYLKDVVLLQRAVHAAYENLRP